MKNIARFLSLMAICGVYQAFSVAQEHQHNHGGEADASQGAHVHSTHIHGTGELLVVLEGDQLDIELRSPAMNLLGFEHHANTPEQKARVESTRKILANADNLFQFDPALCQMTDHRVNFSSVIEDRTQQHKKHPNEVDDADHHDQRDESHGHSDIEAHYRYRCERPGDLQSITTSVTTEFTGIQSLQAQWIAEGRQGATRLDKNQRQIILR